MIAYRKPLKPIQPPPAIAPVTATEDRIVACQTIWGEARGEGRAGMLAVARVIVNRARDGRRRYGGPSLKGVCRKRWQFSCWNESDPNLSIIRAFGSNHPKFAIVAAALDEALGDADKPEWKDIYHYKVRGVAASWAKDRAIAFEIGNHQFYRNIDG